MRRRCVSARKRFAYGLYKLYPLVYNSSSKQATTTKELDMTALVLSISIPTILANVAVIAYWVRKGH